MRRRMSGGMRRMSRCRMSRRRMRPRWMGRQDRAAPWWMGDTVSRSAPRGAGRRAGGRVPGRRRGRGDPAVAAVVGHHHVRGVGPEHHRRTALRWPVRVPRQPRPERCRPERPGGGLGAGPGAGGSERAGGCRTARRAPAADRCREETRPSSAGCAWSPLSAVGVDTRVDTVAATRPVRRARRADRRVRGGTRCGSPTSGLDRRLAGGHRGHRAARSLRERVVEHRCHRNRHPLRVAGRRALSVHRRRRRADRVRLCRRPGGGRRQGPDQGPDCRRVPRSPPISCWPPRRRCWARSADDRRSAASRACSSRPQPQGEPSDRQEPHPAGSLAGCRRW